MLLAEVHVCPCVTALIPGPCGGPLVMVSGLCCVNVSSAWWASVYGCLQEYISTQECATLGSRLVSVADVEIPHHVIFGHVRAERTG